MDFLSDDDVFGSGAPDAVKSAVMQYESGGDSNAVSSKGALGTMQTMPDTLSDPGYGVTPAKDDSDEERERVGKDYLDAMYRKYNGDLPKALAAYNWGPGNVDKHGVENAPKETQSYISNIMGSLNPISDAEASSTLSDSDIWGEQTALSDEDVFGKSARPDYQSIMKGQLQQYLGGENNMAKQVGTAVEQGGRQLVGRMASTIPSVASDLESVAPGVYNQTPVADEIKAKSSSGQPLTAEDIARVGLEPIRSIAGPYAQTAYGYMAPLAPLLNKGTEAADQAAGSKLPGEALESALDIAGMAATPKAIHDNIFPPEKSVAEPEIAPQGEEIQGQYTPISGELPAPENAPIPAEEPAPSAPYETGYHFDSDSFGVKNPEGNFIKTGFETPEEATSHADTLNGNEPISVEEPTPEWVNEPIPENAQSITQEESEGAISPYEPPVESVQPTALPEIPKAMPADNRNYDEVMKSGQFEPPITTDQTPQGRQTVIPADEGLFDVGARGQQDLLAQKSTPITKPSKIIPPSEIGKPTSLYTFLKNNGGKIDENNQLISMKDESGSVRPSDMGLDRATEIAHQAGYFSERPSITELQDKLLETQGGRSHPRIQDVERNLKMQENAKAKQQNDPAYIEHYAHSVGIDTEGKSLAKIKKEIADYEKSQEEHPVVSTIKHLLGDESGAVHSDVYKEIRDTIAPTMGSEGAKKTEIALRDAYGAARRERVKDEMTLNKVAKIASRMGDVDKHDFYNYVEGRSKGAALQNKELQPLADAVRKVYERMRSRLEAMPEMRQMNFVQDYFTHQWKNEKAAQKFINDFIAAQGSGRALKKRVLPTIADGLDAGLELKESNPVRAVSAYLGSMNNYIASIDALRTISNDLGGQYYVKGMQPENYAPLVGRNAERIQNAKIDPISGGIIPAKNMQLYAPKGVATIYNRFYSSGFEDTPIKTTYKLMRGAVNANTLMELGLSGYHAATITIQSLNTDIGRILKNASVGDWKGVMDAAKKLSVVPRYLAGRKGIQQYEGLKNHGIDLEKIADHFARSNMRVSNDPLSMVSKRGFYQAHKRGELPDVIDNLKKQVKEGYGFGLLKSGAEAASRIVSDVSYPMFNNLVPHIKMGAFQDLMGDWLRQNPDATDAQVALARVRIGNLVEDRFGEMNMQNIFWNTKAKQILGLSFRAPGWDIGLIRQAAAPAKDIFSMLNDAAKGKKFNPDNLDRPLFLVGLITLGAALNAAYTYATTGQMPEQKDLTDFIAGRTGAMRRVFGKMVPERIVVPGHFKELVNLRPLPGQSPLSGLAEETKNKIASLPKNIMDISSNRDWKNKPIYDPASKSWTQRTPVVAQGAYLAKGFEPFAIEGMTPEKNQPESGISPFARAFGVRPAGARVTDREDLEKLLNRKK